MKSIAELCAAGVAIEADEAVAITQQLLTTLRDHTRGDDVRPPYGPPTLNNVFLREDGSVVCRGCKATPGVSEVGIFLESLLPCSPRVPGALRYIIARALLNVDVPPFDSLEELSTSLARHERGDRAAAVRNVLRRAAAPREMSRVPRFERRRPLGSTTELRRALREADARLFEQQHLIRHDPVIDLLPPREPAPRGRAMTAAAVCLAAGLALIGTGEFMHHRHASNAEVPNVPAAETQKPLVVTQLAVSGDPDLRAANSLPRGIIAVRDLPSGSRVQPARMQPRRISMKRTPRAAAAAPSDAVRATAQSKSRRVNRNQNAPSRGVLDRLRLGWLRALGPHSSL